MLTALRSLKLFSVNLANPPLVTDTIVSAGSNGMDRCIGSVVYTGLAPVGGPPEIEFSHDGVTWDSFQTAGLDPNAAVGVTGYLWDLQIYDWRFVRVTLHPPNATEIMRGYASLLPVGQN